MTAASTGLDMGGTSSSQSLAFVTVSPILISGKGRLEVRGHGGRPDIPLAVHYCVLPGDHRALPPSILGWDDLISSPSCWLQDDFWPSLTGAISRMFFWVNTICLQSFSEAPKLV